MSNPDSTAGELPRLGSLAQSARNKSLKNARATLIGLGILMVVVNGALFAAARSTVQKELENEVVKLGKQGLVIDPDKMPAILEAAVRTTQLVAGGAVALGVLFIGFGLKVYRYPVPITITGLVLYLGFIALNAVADPLTLVQGLVLKIIIIVLLANAIRAALAGQREAPQVVAPELNG